VRHIPAAKDPKGSLAKLARWSASNAKQKPRLVRITHACGHELTHQTQRYSEKGLAEWKAGLEAHGCGNCVFVQTTPQDLVRQAQTRNPLEALDGDRILGHSGAIEATERLA
jgi:hypothetical protein